MGLLEDARLAEIEAHLDRGCSGHEDGDMLTYCSCFEDDAADLLDEVRRLRAVREAAARVQEPATVEETAVGHALVYAGCDRSIEQGHAPDCEHQALREALDA